MDKRLLFTQGKQAELLLNAQRKFGSQQLISTKLAINRRTYRNWLAEQRTLPLSIFVRICAWYPELASFKEFIVQELLPNWGKVKGGKKRAQNIDMCQVRGAKTTKRLRMKKTSVPPKENEVTKAMKGSDLYAILATFLITDGSVDISSKRMTYASNDPVLSDAVVWLFYKLSEYLPTACTDKWGVKHISLYDNALTDKVLKLSPSYKTSPSHNQSISQYLAEKQPTISFLNSFDWRTKKLCIRTAFSTDGGIVFRLNASNELFLSCAHPSLCGEWVNFLSQFGLNARIKKNKNSWSGLTGVFIYNKKSLQLFWKIGGFLPAVLISGKSKKFKGLTKNEVLKMSVGPWARKQN